MLILFRFTRLLLRFETISSVIDNLAYRCLCIRSHTEQIEVHFIRFLKRFPAHHDTKLFAIGSDNQNFLETNVLIYDVRRFFSSVFVILDPSQLILLN